MKNDNTSPLASLAGFQNPFRLATRKEDLQALRNAEGALARTRSALPGNARDAFTGDAAQRATVSRVLQLAKLGAESVLETERRKPSCVRAFSQTFGGQDDAWKIWAVLSRDVSARVIAYAETQVETQDGDGEPLCGEDLQDARRDAFRAVCAEIWAEWGFSPAPSPLSDYSPTGQMYSSGLSCRVSSGCVVLCQSGARDV